MSYAAKKDNIMVIMEYDNTMNPRTDWDNLGHMMCWYGRYSLGDTHEHKSPNDFLMNLVLDTVPFDNIIDLVKSGKVKDMKMEYDRSQRGWEVSSYYKQFDKWYTDCFYEGNFQENKEDLAYSIVDALPDSALYQLASEQNIMLPLYLYDHSGLAMSTSGFSCPWDSGQVGLIYATKEDIQKEYGEDNKENREKAEKVLTGEVKDYDDYLRGNVYGFRYFVDGAESDSCWGFLGDIDTIKEDIAGYLPDEAKPLLDNLEYIGDKVRAYELGYKYGMEESEVMSL